MKGSQYKTPRERVPESVLLLLLLSRIYLFIVVDNLWILLNRFEVEEAEE